MAKETRQSSIMAYLTGFAECHHNNRVKLTVSAIMTDNNVLAKLCSLHTLGSIKVLQSYQWILIYPILLYTFFVYEVNFK